MNEKELLPRMEWAAFYRKNPARWVNDFLGVRLKDFQKILLTEMNENYNFTYIAARGQGKSFLAAIFCCFRAVNYPGSKIVIAAGQRSQSNVILEYIQNVLMPNSEPLRAEIKSIKISPQDARTDFANTSYIKVVTASDTSRSNRANVLICDEFRMIKKVTRDDILRRFLTSPRAPRYLEKPEYAHLAERNKMLSFSSAYFKDHWSYKQVLDYANHMLNDKQKYFVCALPYQVSIENGLLMKEAVLDEMSESGFNEIKWQMEMEALFWGGEEGAFFDFATVSKNRSLALPAFPRSVTEEKELILPPKQNGEIRILSADIALMASTKHNNDATAVFLNRMLPTKAGRYVSNIVYADACEGLHTEDQALVLRRLFDEFEADYLVLDYLGIGFGVCDALIRDITDRITGEIYPALGCVNNSGIKLRTDPNAKKAIWAINGTKQFNSDCAAQLREGFMQGRIRLLAPEIEGEQNLAEIAGYNKLSPVQKAKLLAPYLHTTLLINELTRLDCDTSGGQVKLSERSGMRKDRYSSLAYNYYVAQQLERQHTVRNTNEKIPFLFKAPKQKERLW